MSLSPEFHCQIYPLLFVSSFKTPDGYAKNTHIQVFWQDVAAVAQSNHQLLTQWLWPVESKASWGHGAKQKYQKWKEKQHMKTLNTPTY